MNRMNIIKKILGFTVVMTMTMGINFSYADSTGKIDNKVYQGLNSVLESKVQTTPTVNSDFMQNVTYKKDRKRASVNIKLSSLENVKVNLKDSGLTIEIPNKSMKYNVFTKDISDRLISNYEMTEQGEYYQLNINLKNNVKATYTMDESLSQISIALDKGAYSPPRIVIDAGHGGNDPGAIIKSAGVNEKTLNLQVASILKDKLTMAGYEVIMNRDSDYFVPLKDRYVNANEADADLFVSIHHNSTTNTATSGIETLHNNSNDNKEIAVYIQNQIISSTGAVNRGTKVRTDLAVLNGTKMPAVLIELGFMTNSGELSKLTDSSYQNTMADAILSGINQYFGR